MIRIFRFWGCGNYNKIVQSHKDHVKQTLLYLEKTCSQFSRTNLSQLTDMFMNDNRYASQMMLPLPQMIQYNFPYAQYPDLDVFGRASPSHSFPQRNYMQQFAKRKRQAEDSDAYDNKRLRNNRWNGERSSLPQSLHSNPQHSLWKDFGGSEENDIPAVLFPGSVTDNITGAMMQYFQSSQQTEEIYQSKLNLRDALFAILRGIFPYGGLYMVGSSVNGFSTMKSDLDMCLMVSPEEINQKKEATEILSIIHRSLCRCSFIKGSKVIRAKVPILKFWDKVSAVECDLNINNAVGIRNTHLLKYYTRLDPRVRPLGLYIKHWARFHDINDASKQTLSSYSLSLMLIHYLQYGCSPPVLPSLQKIEPRKFNNSTNVRDLQLDEPPPAFKSENKMTIGDLFVGFLGYYRSFDFGLYAISVRLGTKIPLDYVKRAQSTGQWKFINIEEPYDLTNTARSVYESHTFLRIRRVFEKSHAAISRKHNVESIFYHPF